MEKIVIISGEGGEEGQAYLVSQLNEKFDFFVVNVDDVFRNVCRSSIALSYDCDAHIREYEKSYGGRWLADEVYRKVCDKNVSFALINNVMTLNQVDALRERFSHRVTHVHLFSEKNTNQALKDKSDISIDVQKCTERDIFERVACLLNLYGKQGERLVDVLIGGQFGSEGKGNVSAYLSREYDYLVRVGGPNAGHKVKTGQDVEYTFHQLPSGTAHSERAKLVIGPGAVILVSQLMQEIEDNRIGPNRLSIDPQATIIEENDILAERVLVGEIASTGSGSGAAKARRIMSRGQGIRLAADCEELRPFLRESLEVFDKAFADGKKIFLEGTQGTGLSLYHGIFPYVTSRDTTVSGCLAEAGISSTRVRKVVMVCRSYPIRVGNPDDPNGEKISGPMSKEVSREEIARRSGVPLDDLKELTSTTLRARRIGEFDWSLLRRSTSLNAPTDIALTFADYISVDNRNARRFDQLTPKTIMFIEEIERFAKAPVSLISTRFHHDRSIIDRRVW